MIELRISNGKAHCEMDGTLKEVLKEGILSINAIYQTIADESPAAAELFEAAITQLVTNEPEKVFFKQ